MAQTDTRPGFRLPWTGDRTDTDHQTAATGLEPTLAAEAPEATAAREATEAPGGAEAPAAQYEAAVDTLADENVPHAMIDSEPSLAHKPNKFMAELSRAMQGAAKTARNETLARLVAEAKTVVEAIHAAAADDAASIRRQADDDVAALRDRSKAEMARIREETDVRITARKSALDGEVDAHTNLVQARVEGVGASVADYEGYMGAFFERMMAEEDPTRIAAMAETMPDPPSLADVAAAIAAPRVVPPVVPLDSMPQMPQWPADAANSHDFEAAEAEAATFTGDDEENPATATDVTAVAEEAPIETAGPPVETKASVERATTRVVVVGLVSVASISTFKRTLGRVDGVSAIGVASGPDGEFVFTVSHDASLDLREAIPGIAGFEARVTAETADGLEVAAHDPDAAD